MIFSLLLIWCLGIFSQYFAQSNESILVLYPFIKKSYSLVCHQETGKLIYFGSAATTVCARCTGIYLGLLLASLISIFKTIKNIPDTKYIVVFALPMIIDVILYSIGIYSYSKVIAFSTGLLFGSAGFLYFYKSVNDLFIEIQLRK